MFYLKASIIVSEKYLNHLINSSFWLFIHFWLHLFEGCAFYLAGSAPQLVTIFIQILFYKFQLIQWVWTIQQLNEIMYLKEYTVLTYGKYKSV